MPLHHRTTVRFFRAGTALQSQGFTLGTIILLGQITNPNREASER